MHSRNPYRSPPDFSALAESYPPLKPHVIFGSSGPTLDFQNVESQRRLTEALLHRDFGISFSVPDTRLCPPIPNRLNYILWLQDIIDYTRIILQVPNERPTLGIDIGTGASAIYPLLGCASRTNWRFVGTDIDDTSLQCAQFNIERNNLQDRITILKSNPSDPIFSLLDVNSVQYDFSMCNPPFYSSREEVVRSAEAKEVGPNSACSGADNEMITSGGEVAFVGQMVRESTRHPMRCQWYTSMLGKMSTLSDVVALLHEQKIENYAITEFVQGQTRRWAIAWTFLDLHLPDSLARLSNPTLQSIMPTRHTLEQTYPATRGVVAPVLEQILRAIQGVSTTDLSCDSKRHLVLIVRAGGNTWSRASRRKKLRGEEEVPEESHEIQLTCRIQVLTSPQDVTSVVYDWVQGRDQGMFESFSSHIGRKVGAALSAEEEKMDLTS
ncbi:S-adenosyl-L-methionine dependent methyltransferase [Abortiporus biennis]|nr:S-adenosyl-L-methionine dependent methyltransferase [Abortiporus biennis]